MHHAPPEVSSTELNIGGSSSNSSEASYSCSRSSVLSRSESASMTVQERGGGEEEEVSEEEGHIYPACATPLSSISVCSAPENKFSALLTQNTAAPSNNNHPSLVAAPFVELSLQPRNQNSNSHHNHHATLKTRRVMSVHNNNHHPAESSCGSGRSTSTNRRSLSSSYTPAAALHYQSPGSVDLRLASTYVPAVAGLLRSSLLILVISRWVCI